MPSNFARDPRAPLRTQRDLRRLAQQMTANGNLIPLTTKGDILGYSTAPARIPVGTDDYALFADSAQVLGVTWKPARYKKSANVTDVTSTGLLDNLMSYVVPANTLSVNTSDLAFEADLTFAATVSQKRVVAKWGTQTVFDTGTFLQNGGVVRSMIRVFRITQTTQHVIGDLVISGNVVANLTGLQSYLLGTQDLATAITVQIQGGGANAGDVTQHVLDVEKTAG